MVLLYSSHVPASRPPSDLRAALVRDLRRTRRRVHRPVSVRSDAQPWRSMLIADDALANWQWLVPITRRDDAVVLTNSTGLPTHHIVQGYANTRYFDPSLAGGDFNVFRCQWIERFPGGSLDCVAAPSLDRRLAEWSSPARMLETFRASLRPGSGFYVAGEAVRRTDRRTRWDAFLPSRQESLIRAAGFSRIWAFYVVHSPSTPLHLIPIATRSVLAWDRAMTSSGLRAGVRAALTVLGMHSVLFRYRLLVAQA